MLESIFNSSNIYYVMGAVVLGGVVSKFVANVSLNGLVRGASHMAKSTHSFMKLVRAKFEHACMVNDHVENVEVFIEKYIHEYQVLGIRLHKWQRMEKVFAVAMALVVAATGGYAYYYAEGGEVMLQRTGIGVALLAALLGIYQLSDEKFKMQTMKIYMIDYLENVCALRYSREHGSKEKLAIPSLREQAVVEQEQSDKRRADSKITKNASQKLEEQMANIQENRNGNAEASIASNLAANVGTNVGANAGTNIETNIESKKSQKKNRREQRRGKRYGDDLVMQEEIKAMKYGTENQMQEQIQDKMQDEMQMGRGVAFDFNEGTTSDSMSAEPEQRTTLSMVEKLLIEEAERREEWKKRKQDDYMPNEATIREILQEFMA